MSNELKHQRIDSDRAPIYQVRLKGHLGQEWTDWFGGLNIRLERNGETLITGPALDQAALHGLLKKVRDLGLTLVSVNSVEPNQTDTLEAKPSNAIP